MLGFGDPTKGMTRILGHFVILDECECAILRLQIMLITCSIIIRSVPSAVEASTKLTWCQSKGMGVQKS